jgi:hypothetical protein
MIPDLLQSTPRRPLQACRRSSLHLCPSPENHTHTSQAERTAGYVFPEDPGSRCQPGLRRPTLGSQCPITFHAPPQSHCPTPAQSLMGSVKSILIWERPTVPSLQDIVHGIGQIDLNLGSGALLQSHPRVQLLDVQLVFANALLIVLVVYLGSV